MFTGKGNQYWFIIYKGSHWSVMTCGRSARQVLFAASSICGRVQLPSAPAQPKGRLILRCFFLPCTPKQGWQEPTALPRGQAAGSTAAPARHRHSPLSHCCPREPTHFHPSPHPQVGPAAEGQALPELQAPLGRPQLPARSLCRAAISAATEPSPVPPFPMPTPAPSFFEPLVPALASRLTLALVYLKLRLHAGHPLGKFPVAVSPQQTSCVAFPGS